MAFCIYLWGWFFFWAGFFCWFTDWLPLRLALCWRLSLWFALWGWFTLCSWFGCCMLVVVMVLMCMVVYDFDLLSGWFVYGRLWFNLESNHLFICSIFTFWFDGCTFQIRISNYLRLSRRRWLGGYFWFWFSGWYFGLRLHFRLGLHFTVWFRTNKINFHVIEFTAIVTTNFGRTKIQFSNFHWFIISDSLRLTSFHLFS